MKTPTVIVLLVIIAAIVSLTLLAENGSVSLKEGAITEIGQLLAFLFVISLFVERALDVFLTTWRAPKGEQLDSQIQELQQKISRIEALKKDLGTADDAELKKLVGVLEETKQERSEYRAKTRLIALWSGLMFGLLVSAVGIRTFGVLIEPDSLSKLPRIQVGLLRILDVSLTGGLIAGGSDGIHKLIEVYRSVTEASTAAAKARRIGS